MKIIKLALVIFCILAAEQALGFACRYYPDHNELDLSGDLGEMSLLFACPGGGASLLGKPVIIFLHSPGGNIDQIIPLATEMLEFATAVRNESGMALNVVVSKECQSACLPILAALDKMAGAGLVNLVVDPKTELGFHGTSDRYANDPKDYFSTVGTKRYLKYFSNLGANPEWLAVNSGLFDSSEVTKLFPKNRGLTGAGIVDHALVLDAEYWMMTFREANRAFENRQHE